MANHIGAIWEGGGSHHGLAFSVINQLGEDSGGQGSAVDKMAAMEAAGGKIEE